MCIVEGAAAHWLLGTPDFLNVVARCHDLVAHVGRLNLPP